MSINPSAGADHGSPALAPAVAIIYLPGCEPTAASPPGKIGAGLQRIRGYGAAPEDDMAPPPSGIEGRVYWWRNGLWRWEEGPRWLRFLRAVPVPYKKRIARLEQQVQELQVEADAVLNQMRLACELAGAGPEAAPRPPLQLLVCAADGSREAIRQASGRPA
jgi:hypothetical protein